MAEFALVLPIFLLILFGIIDGGRMIFVSNQLSEAARDGARWGSVQERSTTSAGRDSIDDRVIGILNGVPTPDVTISCERDESAIPDCRFGDILVVRVESDFQFATPFLGGLMGEPTLSAESKVVVHQ
jgi:TadE-like protein